MALSAKHFRLIAGAIAQAEAAPNSDMRWASGCDSARSYIALHIADELAKDHPRFDRQRFLDACRVTDL